MPKRLTAVDLREQHQQIVELVELNDSRTRSFQQLERYFQNLTILAPLSPDPHNGMVVKEATPSLPKGLFPGSVTPTIVRGAVESCHNQVRTLLSKINTVKDDMVLTGRLFMRLNEHYDITNCYTYARDHLDEALGITNNRIRPLQSAKMQDCQQQVVSDFSRMVQYSPKRGLTLETAEAWNQLNDNVQLKRRKIDSKEIKEQHALDGRAQNFYPSLPEQLHLVQHLRRDISS